MNEKIMAPDNEIERILQGISQCDEGVDRRQLVDRALSLRFGEKCLEVGCGVGAYTHDAAKRVGAQRRMCAIDTSKDRVESTRANCQGFHWVECVVGDAMGITYDSNKFHAVFVNHALEHVSDVDKSLSEVFRVLRPSGRLLILSTNWDSLVWYSTAPDRMKPVLQAWNEQVMYLNLPSILPTRLRRQGFEISKQIPVPVFNNTYDESSISYWLARLIYYSVRSLGTLDDGELDDWLSEFDELHERGDYYFCSTPMITVARKAALA